MSRDTSHPSIDPMPPAVGGIVPVVGAGLGLMRDPVGFFRRHRRRLGDTYVADAFGHRMFCVFSPAGLRALYAVAEEDASFGLATYELVFKHKVPLEMLIGRRNRPHDLFGREEVEHYIEVLEEAVEQEIAALGQHGRFEIFRLARRLGYRLGLASWAGREAASPEYLDRLIRHFDVLDASDSFVRPLSLLVTRATGKRRELAAMRGIETIVADILQRRERLRSREDDFLDQIYSSFEDLEPAARRRECARDIMVIQMGAQSNLYAALAWTLVDLLLRPGLAEQVRDGDDRLLERCANESIRMAQRSLTLRKVMRPIEIAVEDAVYKLSPGVLLTTMLAVNNCTAADTLRSFDPDHYDGRRLADNVPLIAKESVSTFGHGRHSCPAQRFSITAIRLAVGRLLRSFVLRPEFDRAAPVRRQIGGVARAADPCWVRYERGTVTALD